jgi:hypothetical protein
MSSFNTAAQRVQREIKKNRKEKKCKNVLAIPQNILEQMQKFLL